MKETLTITVTFNNQLSPKNNDNYKRQVLRSYLDGKGVLNDEHITFQI